MTKDVADLLDELAAGATAGRSVDAGAVLERGRRRHRDLVRRRAVLAAAAVAAVLALLAVIDPRTATVGPRPAPPAGAPQGLPQRWWTPPPWVPSVLDAPIPAAALVLSAPVMRGFGSMGTGYVAVSADGTGYRRLPMAGPEVAAVSLSPDGGQVAWVTRQDLSAPQTLHVLRLADGRRSDVTLPDGSPANPVDSILWPAPARVVAASSMASMGPAQSQGALESESGSGEDLSAWWSVDLGSRRAGPERPGPVPVAVGAAGAGGRRALYFRAPGGNGRTSSGERAPTEPGDVVLPGAGRSGDFATGPVVVAPDGSAWARLTRVDAAGEEAAGEDAAGEDAAGEDAAGQDGPGRVHVLVVPVTGAPRTLALDLPDTGHTALVAWGPGGLLLGTPEGTPSSDGDLQAWTLVTVDPGTGTITAGGSRRSSTDDGGIADGQIVAAATGLASAGAPVPGARPDTTGWTRDRLLYALGSQGWIFVVVPVGAVLTLVAVGGLRRRRPALTVGLLTVGSFVPFGWLAGVILLWSSRLWTAREKLVGTLVVPGGPGALVLVTMLMPGQVCTDGVCTGVGDQVPLPALRGVLAAAALASVAVPAWLYRRARRRH